jgi:iron complex transport system substrate-binding protein
MTVAEVALFRMNFGRLAIALQVALGCPVFHCMGAVAEEIRVKDQRGHIVRLARPAERVVAIPIPMASVVMALDGSSRRVVGMHPSARLSIEEGFLGRIFPEALSIRADITRGGMFSPNLESLLQLRPDAVIQWTEPAEAVNAVERARMTVVALTDSPTTQESQERNLTIVGEVIGQSARTAALLAEQRRVHAEISTITAALPDAARPRVLYLRSYRPVPSPAGRNTYQDFWMRLVGGRNVADTVGLHIAINLEQVIVWNPQIIFIGAFDSVTPAEILGNPALERVDAVRHRRVYKLPHGGYRWDPASHESHLGWRWAAMLTHPERFHFDLRRHVREVYQSIYRYEPTDADIDGILQMPLNRASAGYDVFSRR